MMYAIRHYDMANPYPESTQSRENVFIRTREEDEGLSGAVGKSFVERRRR
jgi:hypothetical protein